MEEDIEKIFNEFCKKYEIPEDELDKFILLMNKPFLSNSISNLREELNNIIDEMEEELTE